MLNDSLRLYKHEFLELVVKKPLLLDEVTSLRTYIFLGIWLLNWLRNIFTKKNFQSLELGESGFIERLISVVD